MVMETDKDKLIVKEYYLSSDTNSIPIYSYDKEQNTMNETKKIPQRNSSSGMTFY